MIRKKLFILVFILLLIPLVYAQAEVTYSEAGDFDNLYTRGFGVFNLQLDPNNVSISTVIISDPKKVPLVNDLDGDGIQEIIVLDGITINIFQNTSLDLASSLTLDAPNTERFSNMITFDIDGDGFIEIILFGETRNLLHILQYNKSNLIEDNIINFSNGGRQVGPETVASTSGQVMLGCESTNRCLMVYSATQTTTDPATTLFASHFNFSDIRSEIIIDQFADIFCMPKIRHITTADVDPTVDTSVEFIFTVSEPNPTATGGSGDEVNIFWLDITSNNSVVLDSQRLTTEVGEIFQCSGSDCRCDDSTGQMTFRFSGGFGTPLPGKYFTSPLVFDAKLDGLGANALETIVGIMADNNEYSMIMYDKEGTEIREFPFGTNTEGQIISNVFAAEVFDDSTSALDFCILGQVSTAVPDEGITVTCGSQRDSNGFGALNLQTIDFRSKDTFGLPFNISDNFDFFGIMVHSGEHDETNSESEIITSYGILELDTSGGLFSNCFLFNNCDLNALFLNTKIDGTVITTDLEGVEQEDLLILTQNNLFYIDDGFTNQPVNPFCGEPGSVGGTCTIYFTNPCLDSTWKLNTTVEVKITPKDPEADTIQVTATLYADDINAQTQTLNVSSGTETPFNFIANKTIGIGSGKLRMTVVDIIENPGDPQVLTKAFSVAEAGVETNDCTTLVDDGIDDEVGVECNTDADCGIDEFCTLSGVCKNLTEDEDDNAIVSGLITIKGILGLGTTTLWLVIMLAIVIGIWFEGARMGFGGATSLGAIGIFSLLMVILGVRLGVLSTSLIVIMTILGILIISVFLGRFLTGMRSSDG